MVSFAASCFRFFFNVWGLTISRQFLYLKDVCTSSWNPRYDKWLCLHVIATYVHSVLGRLVNGTGSDYHNFCRCKTVSPWLTPHPNVHICLFSWEKSAAGAGFSNSDLSFVYHNSPLEFLPWYLQFAHGWVGLILIKFNLFSCSIWKRPKCCLPSVWELSDSDGWPVHHLSPGSRCGEGTCVWCAPAFLHSGPHTWLVHPNDCHFIRFLPRCQPASCV